MGYIKRERSFDADGNRITRTTITGNAPWKMRIWKVKEDGSRLPYWRANNDDDLKEWIDVLKEDNELNGERLDFIITEDGKDRETVGEYCTRMGYL